jgi:hypothetical protein
MNNLNQISFIDKNKEKLAAIGLVVLLGAVGLAALADSAESNNRDTKYLESVEDLNNN